MNGVCLIQIFQLDFFSAAAATIAIRFGVFIRLNFDSISDHGRPCALVYVVYAQCTWASERAPAWNDHFLPFGGKNVYCRYWCFRVESNSLSLLCLIHSCTAALYTINEIALAFMYFLRFVHIFHLLSFAIAFDSFPLSFFFSSSKIRFVRSFACLLTR